MQEVQNAIFKSFYRGTAGDNSATENENDGEETTEEGNRAREAWRKTPYQITTLFKYHKEYNQHIFRQEQAGTSAATENMDDIDIALGGF